MSRTLHVSMLPALTSEDELADAVVVVIDVLRATTTIVHALAAGATGIIPCLEVDEAFHKAANLPPDLAVLAGERGGLPIDGFDLGNSPAEFNAEAVSNKTLVFTTTNGTRAMMMCRCAARVLLAGFVNLSAVCHAVTDQPRVHLLCAGTQSKITREDVLLAGALADEILRASTEDYQLNDQAVVAIDAWRTVSSEIASVPLTQRLRASQGGRNMLKIGQESDIDIAAQIDQFDIAPELNLRDWIIQAP